MMMINAFRSVIYLSLVLATLTNAVYGKCRALEKEPWSYEGKNRPKFWGETYSTCNGQEQSPILINAQKVAQGENLDKLTLNNYDQPITRGTIENNGHTIEVKPDDGTSRTISINGLEYKLIQFHFHWGSDSSKGSEHTIKGAKYTMEMHLVHKTDDGQIAVVGLLFKEEKDDNEELQKIVDGLSSVKYKENEAELPSEINLNKILPENPASFYRYQGSLTTPPCTEGVTWSVLRKPVMIGKAQMKQFRTQLYSVTKEDADCKLVNNYRPAQPLNDRNVLSSQ